MPKARIESGFIFEEIPNSPYEKICIGKICIGMIEYTDKINRGYHAHIGSYVSYERSIPFELRSVYGFVSPIDVANYLYKLYVQFKDNESSP